MLLLMLPGLGLKTQAVNSRSIEYIRRGDALGFKAEKPATPGEMSIPGNIKMFAFIAVNFYFFFRHSQLIPNQHFSVNFFSPGERSEALRPHINTPAAEFAKKRHRRRTGGKIQRIVPNHEPGQIGESIQEGYIADII